MIGTQKNSLVVTVSEIIKYHDQYMARTEYGDMDIDLLYEE